MICNSSRTVCTLKEYCSNSGFTNQKMLYFIEWHICSFSTKVIWDGHMHSVFNQQPWMVVFRYRWPSRTGFGHPWPKTSGLHQDGHSLLSTPKFWSYALIKSALWRWGLLSWGIVWSQTVEMWDWHWLQNFIPPSWEGDDGPHHHTSSIRRCYSSGAAITKASSVSSPHFDSKTIQVPQAESG